MKKSRFIKNLKFYFLGFLAATAFLVWFVVLTLPPGDSVSVNYLDVGQGDAIFIQTPAGNQVLVDGGPNSIILSRLGRLMPFYDRSIDLMILTHPQLDHMAGLIEVAKRYKIGRILTTGVLYNSPAFAEWQKVIEEKNIPVTIAKKGQKIRLGSGVYFEILHPEKDLAGKYYSGDVNNASIVGRLSFGKNSFLLTGDIEAPVEIGLAAENGANLASDVLKVAHHGSKTSSSEEFLKAVGPKIAVIQVGRKNSYGHPTREVLTRLGQFGTQIFRNDINGTVEILSNGRELKVKTER
ncbi:hypothetical protein A3J02_02950 [Candidatus Azambacteria bacterium RIFCSPLOWO2_02_FULL_46_11]|uniref:Metallo-beta-lactamase domain-containing protein n=1 Tax=Candidatus Azambacteria bacterium RIFCSPLOWO2_02_FULL_46_11 TaxID=1797300 RepID=A0A1F5CPS8_9BACT|nr:MAG: hypothetical protein A3J02_02950 [Candidatus Azambacteria bacterium RIFCSPLOWO2_02_FULL_46_11]